MKKKIIGIIAIGLWFITIFSFGYLFYFGKTSKKIDDRSSVHLSVEEQQLVLTEMRAMLSSLNQVIGGLADNDYEKAALAADRVGMGLVSSLEHQEKSILLKLPAEFKILGFGTHEKFDKLAKNIRDKKEIHLLLKEMENLTNNCIACHASYKISIESNEK